MSKDCRALLLQRIHEHGPLTFADFMDIALYDPEVGYYATADRRSGRGGDFYTSVDVGPVFGEFLARQFEEMIRLLSSEVRSPKSEVGNAPPEIEEPTSDIGHRTSDYVDLVEAAAGDGRLSRDVLNALEKTAPDVYARVRVHLVERSTAARQAQAATLGSHAEKIVTSGPDLPASIHGILFANELLDALPTHALVSREEGLREIFVDADGDRLVEREGPPTTPAIEEYFRGLGIRLEPGWRAEVNLAAIEWMQRAADALRRGFVVLVDYGDEAAALYSAARAQGTLATFTGHVVDAFDQRREPPWLRSPGTSDITAHVDFTSIRNAAAASGLEPVCVVDQMRFLLGLGVEDWLARNAGPDRQQLERRLALKTLLVPGGLGSSHRVLVFGKDMGRPVLKGCR